MQNIIFGLSLLVLFISCAKDEPKTECKNINCNSSIAYYSEDTKYGLAMEKHIAAVTYQNCCGKAPKSLLNK